MVMDNMTSIANQIYTKAIKVWSEDHINTYISDFEKAIDSGKYSTEDVVKFKFRLDSLYAELGRRNKEANMKIEAVEPEKQYMFWCKARFHDGETVTDVHGCIIAGSEQVAFSKFEDRLKASGWEEVIRPVEMIVTDNPFYYRNKVS